MAAQWNGATVPGLRDEFLPDEFLPKDIQELEKDWHRVKQELENAVGRDVCPECGSLAVVPIVYGLCKPVPGEEWRLGVEFVFGGCIQNSRETRCCLDCGKRFLGNLDKWLQAYIAKAGNAPATKRGKKRKLSAQTKAKTNA